MLPAAVTILYAFIETGTPSGLRKALIRSCNLSRWCRYRAYAVPMPFPSSTLLPACWTTTWYFQLAAQGLLPPPLFARLCLLPYFDCGARTAARPSVHIERWRVSLGLPSVKECWRTLCLPAFNLLDFLYVIIRLPRYFSYYCFHGMR